MGKQGIITGVGNEITPEIDAVINDYIVGKNTILKGLELNGNILSAGTCILCGYRGTLENSQTVDGNYVYGKFVIGVNETDSFSIFTSRNSTDPTDGIINPTSITSAGTYYLRLYANGASQVDSERYPKQADISDRARDLIAGGIIDSTATTETAPLNDNSKRVANTKYVHNQIVAEVAKLTKTGSLLDIYGTARGSYSLTRKAKLVTIDLTFNSDWAGVVQKFVPNDCLPNKTIYFFVVGGNGMTSCLSMNTNGDIQLVSGAGNMSTTVTTSIGYECQ